MLVFLHGLSLHLVVIIQVESLLFFLSLCALFLLGYVRTVPFIAF